jgi:hypothetical protein
VTKFTLNRETFESDSSRIKINILSHTKVIPANFVLERMKETVMDCFEDTFLAYIYIKPQQETKPSAAECIFDDLQT